MKIELDKKALISLVMGEQPYYSLFDNESIKLCGSYDDNRGCWSWLSYELEKYSDEQLYDLYWLCRKSWIK